jgi:hypothetical protein
MIEWKKEGSRLSKNCALLKPRKELKFMSKESINVTAERTDKVLLHSFCGAARMEHARAQGSA